MKNYLDLGRYETFNIFSYKCVHQQYLGYSEEITVSSLFPKTKYFEFYTHGFVHHDSILIISSKVQQPHAGIYLLQIYSTCFGCPSHPSSGAHKNVTAASGTGHIT